MSRTPWWRGAVVAGDAGPVEAEHHRQAVEADVEVGLVEGPGEERGVHGDHRAQAAHGHAGGGGDGVLLGDADVDEPLGEALCEGQQAGGAGHGRGDGDQLGSGLALLDDGLGERRGVAGPGPSSSGRRVVQVLLVVVLGRRVALALLGEDVDDDGPVELGGVAQRLLEARGCRGRRTGPM